MRNWTLFKPLSCGFADDPFGFPISGNLQKPEFNLALVNVTSKRYNRCNNSEQY